MTMDSITKILSTLLSWPVVIFVLAIIFSKQLKLLFETLVRRNASLKLPGNIEVSLNELEEHTEPAPIVDIDKQFSATVAALVAKLPDRSPESIRKTLDEMLTDHRKADLHLYLKTVSYQLLAWLFSHRDGEPFGIADLLVTTRIPIECDGKRAGAYCVHSTYEKDAVASEFRRNYWNLKRYGIIDPVNDKQVRVTSNGLVQNILAGAMEEVCRVEHERNAIESFVQKFITQPVDEAKKLYEGTSKRDESEIKKSAEEES